RRCPLRVSGASRCWKGSRVIVAPGASISSACRFHYAHAAMRFVCADGEKQFKAVLDTEPVQSQGHELVWYDGPPEDVDEWRGRLDGAEGVMLMWGIPAGVLSAVPSLRVISFAGSGAASYVPLDEAARCGVTICNVPSYGANAVAEHALALT